MWWKTQDFWLSLHCMLDIMANTKSLRYTATARETSS